MPLSSKFESVVKQKLFLILGIKAVTRMCTSGRVRIFLLSTVKAESNFRVYRTGAQRGNAKILIKVRDGAKVRTAHGGCVSMRVLEQACCLECFCDSNYF